MKPFRHLSIALLAATLSSSAHAAEGIPQMDPAWFSNQLAWLAISFLLLYALVSRVVVPSVSGVLAKRDATITEAIAAAEAYKHTAQNARGDSESRAHAVHEQVTVMMQEAKAQATHTSAEALARLNAELEAKTAKSLAELDRVIAAAQAEMQAATAEVARTIAEKLLGRAVDAGAFSNATKNAA